MATKKEKNLGRSVTKLIIYILVGQLVLIGYVAYTGYQDRVRVVDAQQAGCERGKLDRRANAKGWRNAEDARRAAGEIRVANVYKGIAEELERRSAIACETVYPEADLLP